MLCAFLKKFKEYFETDCRFHLWVGTADNSGTLVFDHHNVLIAYGQIDKYIHVLKQEGYRKHKFSLPAPHVHQYYPDNDKYEDSIINCCDWRHFPLADDDEY
jgi:hypothetical protein